MRKRYDQLPYFPHMQFPPILHPLSFPYSFGCKNSYFTDIGLVVLFPDCGNAFSGCALLEFWQTHFYGIPPLAGPWHSFPAWHLYTLSRSLTVQVLLLICSLPVAL